MHFYKNKKNVYIQIYIYVHIYCLCSYLGSQHFWFKMASNSRTYDRAKSTIDLSTLKELMKEHMGDGPKDTWLEAGDVLTLSLYLHFFVSLGQVTTRVNKLAIAGCADDLWKLGKHKANLFGTALKLSLMQRRLGTKQLMAASSLAM